MGTRTPSLPLQRPSSAAPAILSGLQSWRRQKCGARTARHLRGRRCHTRQSGHSAVEGRLRFGRVSRHAAEQAALEENIAETITTLESQGKTVVVLIKGKTIEGLIALRDEPRDDAIEGVKRLTDRGVRPLMLTGDNKRTADAIAAHLGLEASAELLPDAKLAEIGRLKANGPIAMVGDGINDAPALAAASVGVAMGAGTDVALETADAALLRNRVTGVADLIGLSQATLGNIWQNIAIALGLKAVFLVTTLFGITTLWMAILADTGATVPRYSQCAAPADLARHPRQMSPSSARRQVAASTSRQESRGVIYE